MMARTPEPKSFFPEFGESRAIIVGRRYESVFPVPVGEIAARSRFYIDENFCVTAKIKASAYLEEYGNGI